MAVQSWHEEWDVSAESVHPLEVRDMFLRLVPFVLIFLMAAGVISSLKITKSIDLPDSLIPLPGQAATAVLTINPDSVYNQSNAEKLSGAGITPTLSPVFTDQVKFWEPQIQAWSEKWGLDPNLIATIMQIESCGDPGALSSAGAQGLFQVMPFHFTSGEDPIDPDTNAFRGMSHMLKSIQAHAGDISLAFAGYNAGIAGSKRPRSAWANETSRYVYWATGIYQDAIGGNTESDRLSEWLDAGGRSLCRQAQASQELK